ncbi:hypothetical protein GGR06_001659 [Bacteroides reticulotermitis]|uniref:Uncharacterized protein n=1 Tax=Bacteroides reticulotermitis TaxID=1133319 RepID=A0A840D648_9BACE|nr:hypothetical protein [Bacteroides reticulotermitis]MBB4043873.1 hypothetical protein [Bacteroides reticulotermitis]
MKKVTIATSSMMQRNQPSQSSRDDQTDLLKSSNGACPQSEGLSSKGEGSPEKEVELSQTNLSKYPDGTRAQQVYPQQISDIPNRSLEQFQNLHCDTLLHEPCMRCDCDCPKHYLSEEHRKEQLAYLNGR